MTGWLLDTNVVSELNRRKPNRQVVRWIESCPAPSLFISVITLAEIRFGMELQPDPLRRTQIEAWLEGSVRPFFANRIVDIDENILLRWRMLGLDLQRQGKQISPPDLLIAATATYRGFKVVTRDERHFTDCGLTVVNPWTGKQA